jgi:PAS domain S-box-containing protein
MGIPLIAKDQVLGTLHFRSKESNAYSEKDLNLAEKVANQIAGAIANALLFAEQKRTEEALRESETRFKDLYDNAPLGYHEYDAEGRITKVNHTDEEMLGYSTEEMVGQFIWKLSLDEEDARRQVSAKLAGNLPPGRNLERTYRRKDGTTFQVLIEDRLILDATGKIKGIRCTIQDITQWKKAKEEVAALQEQLRQSQKMEAIGRLAGGVAHDFNNLLTIIKGYSQLSLMELKEEDPLKGNIEIIQKASERAAELTRQLLAFSRRQIMEPKVLDLNGLLRDMEKMLHRVIGEDIELVTLLAEDLGRTKIDPGQIEQVILNLAVNARDAMPSGGKLTIETANVELDEAYAINHDRMAAGRYVMLSVSDTGQGMTSEVKEQIFDPFFTTKEKGKGTGLGLSMVYGIVKQSGGNVSVYSEPGHGTAFKVYLPRVEEETSALARRDEASSMPRGDETVLLVEDEPSVRDLAVHVLRRQGYNVLEAPDGNRAFLLAQNHSGEKIHLLVTDVVMPQMGGRELANRLKSIRSDIKVLFISGYTDNAIVHHGVLDPGIEFLQKPFSPSALVQKVREVLDRC